VTPEPALFRDLAYVFAAALVGGGLAWLARQPLIIGYVVGGILISPLTPGPSVSDVHTFEVFAEIGVILLMFSVGIEFSLRDLLRVRWVALGGGPLGIGLSVLLGLATGWVVGWRPLEGIVVGMVISVASTMVLARLLMDRGELHSLHGRNDPDVVQGLRARGVPCLFGDASERGLLEAAGTAHARLVVVALPEIAPARLAVREARALNATVPILARASHRDGAEGLRAAGATLLVLPELEGARALIEGALVHLALPRERRVAYLELFRAAMERGGQPTARAGEALPEIREVRLPAGPLADQSLREARIRERFGVTVVAVTRAGGDVVANPPPDTILRPGDGLRLFGLPAQIEAFLAAAADARGPTTAP